MRNAHIPTSLITRIRFTRANGEQTEEKKNTLTHGKLFIFDLAYGQKTNAAFFMAWPENI